MRHLVAGEGASGGARFDLQRKYRLVVSEENAEGQNEERSRCFAQDRDGTG